MTRADELARELTAMFEADQALRREAAGDRERWPALAALDRSHTVRLREIVDEIGWPSIPLVGEIAAQAAWLIAQHADQDRAFQRRCLELMRELPDGAVWPRHIAYLEDRVLVGAGEPQRYGTQLRPAAGGGFEPAPITDPARVDERRASVGLEPLAEYLALARESLR